MIVIREHLERLMESRRVRIGAPVALLALAAFVAAWMIFVSGVRRPPSIFDSPADHLAGYLATADFSRLPMQERLDFISGLMNRFSGMSQSDSALVAAFFAGLGGPSREQLRNNVRILAKDILVEGATEYLALPSDEQRAQFLDHWIVKWVRFSEQMGRHGAAGTDEEILGRMHRQAERDARHPIDLDAGNAQQLIDFWQSDIAPVSTPREQGQLARFLPDLRNHMLQSK